MAFETRITVPTRDLDRLSRILRRNGAVILDLGERTTTDEGLGAEATCHVLFVEETAAEETILGVSV